MHELDVFASNDLHATGISNTKDKLTKFVLKIPKQWSLNLNITD